MHPYHSQRGMVTPLVLALMLIGAAMLGAGYAHSPSPTPSSSPQPTASTTVQLPATGEISPLESPVPNTLVAEFSMAGYQNAVKTGKLVALYFSANWSPQSTEQFTKFQTAIRTLANARVAAFRVDYNDSDTDSEEKTAATTLQVGSEHTLVIVQDGQAVYKINDAVDYKAAISQYLKK